jgi:cation transport regulator ChaC
MKGKMMMKYYAYGSCTNLNSFNETLNTGGFDGQYKIISVGRSEGYKLAFTRKMNSSSGALDIIESAGDYVLGVVYEIPDAAISTINKREGYPTAYKHLKINVSLGEEKLEVLTYVVVDKHREEVCPSKEYYNRVLEGMKNRFPKTYINQYFISHYNEKFGGTESLLGESNLYHDADHDAQFKKQSLGVIEENELFYRLLR